MEQGGEGTLLHTAHRGVAQAVLVVDHVALLLNLLGGDGDTARPVSQHEHTGVEGRLTVGADVGHIIDRAVDAGVGIQTTAVLHTDGLQVFGHGSRGEVLRAVEGHVLQEVGQSLLGVVLLDGAHPLGDVEVGLLLRGVVVTEVVRQTVVKVPDSYTLVNGDVWHLLCRSQYGCKECNDDGKKLLSHLVIILITISVHVVSWG